ncbi:MAG: hypothetical protein ACI8W8_002060 [Rhodothermales bacterium]|jgi:hypothetical protein
MANLLYVKNELLAKLRCHPAVAFWQPIVELFPKRPIHSEERSFFERSVDIEEGLIYVTADLNFVYCRNNMLSFLYEDQDLSYRFTAGQGILRTMDGKQFTAILGAVARVISSADVALINIETVFHPLFDLAVFNKGPIEVPPPPERPTRPKKKEAPKPRAKAAKPPRSPRPARRPAAAAPKAPASSSTDLILGKYAHSLASEIVSVRDRSRRGYADVAGQFNLPVDEVKAICHEMRARARRTSTKPAGTVEQIILSKFPADTIDQVVRMKTVSKKSYKYVSERFDIPIETVQQICKAHIEK